MLGRLAQSYKPEAPASESRKFTRWRFELVSCPRAGDRPGRNHPRTAQHQGGGARLRDEECVARATGREPGWAARSSTALELIVADHLAVGSVAQAPIKLHVDGVLEEADRAVAEGEVRPAGMIAGEATHQGGEFAALGETCVGRVSHFGLGLVRVDEAGRAPLSAVDRGPGVAERGTRARGPAEVRLLSRLLAEVDRARGAVRDVVDAEVAVEEEDPLVVHVDRRLDVVVA